MSEVLTQNDYDKVSAMIDYIEIHGGIMKRFNVTGVCRPDVHYMVKLDKRMQEVRRYIDAGDYFSIHRARQYGKSTMLQALAADLADDYFVLDLDFQMLSSGDFESEGSFSAAFARELLESKRGRIPVKTAGQLEKFIEQKGDLKLANLFLCLSEWCRQAARPIVLMIDEVDSASNYQIFLDFLAQLRGYYNRRTERPIFWSVILAGVYDIRNLKQKIGQDMQYKRNSPWNIAAEFDVDLSFGTDDIAGMLTEYEADHQTGMDIALVSNLIYEYTSGYPYLVSRICKLLDETLIKNTGSASGNDVWTKAGVLEAVRLLLAEKNSLFESMADKLMYFKQLKTVLSGLLFTGKNIAYNPDDEAVDLAQMFGFVKSSGGNLVISNRIFETRLYNMFLTMSETQNAEMYKAALKDKNQFIQDGHLDMRRVLERFTEHFSDLYGDREDTFYEEDGRRYFLLYLRPIINGTGNYYIESETRNMERTDVIIDYCGEQFVVEMKIWRGQAYHSRGEKQLLEYLDYYHLKKGYMLSFNFNKSKTIGIQEIVIGDKILVEAVV